MSKQYTFRELIESQLRGVIWQRFDYIFEEQWEDMNCVGLIELERLNEIVDPNIYRIKPKVRKVRYCNGVELPQCETKQLKMWTPYYSPCIYSESGISTHVWGHHETDFVLLKNGLIYLEKSDAQAHLKALMSVEIREIEDA